MSNEAKKILEDKKREHQKLVNLLNSLNNKLEFLKEEQKALKNIIEKTHKDAYDDNCSI